MDFILGCNYWASNAGIEMWKNWDENAIRDDFKILCEHGVKHLRVFPLWRDFQPVSPLFDGAGIKREYRVHEDKLPENNYYLDETMLKRFERFCDIADEFGLKLIVGILTGWMSGRLFIPPALYGKNLYTDSTALMFELKYVEGFVKHFKNKSAILGWDLGNECNCLAKAEDYEVAEVWTGIISNAIRANDPTRIIVSGMHSLSVEDNWRIEGQAAYTDMLTTHPYPFFVNHCSKDKFSSMRTLLHATCETKYYADIAGKPCLVEELGNLGPMMCNDEIAGNFLKVNLFSNWAHNSPGVMWWCANDQMMLETPPYCWNMCEVELGLIDKNREAKSTLKEMKKFAEWLKETDITLPKAKEDGVLIVTEGQDQWGVAYMSYLLAKEAKVNLKFAYAMDEIPQADFYMLPSVDSMHIMLSTTFNELKERIYNGAVLYISNNDSVISEFKELTGVEIVDSQTSADSGKFTLNGKELDYSRTRKFTISETNAKVICSDEQGMPILTVCEYGKGKVYYANFPVESMLLELSDAHETNQFEIYREIFAEKISEHIADSDCRYIGITEHMAGANSAYIVLINYSDKTVNTNLKIKDGFSIESVILGDPKTITPFDTTIIKVKKNS